MINWEELKHIHVIRKLEEILGNWFSTDIFFIDEKGEFTNWQPGEKKDFKNKLSQMLAQTPEGQRKLRELAHEATEKIVKSDKTNMIDGGIIGPEKSLISRIVIDNDYLGSVLAYPILEKDPDKVKRFIHSARSASNEE